MNKIATALAVLSALLSAAVFMAFADGIGAESTEGGANPYQAPNPMRYL